MWLASPGFHFSLTSEFESIIDIMCILVQFKLDFSWAMADGFTGRALSLEYIFCILICPREKIDKLEAK